MDIGKEEDLQKSRESRDSRDGNNNTKKCPAPAGTRARRRTGVSDEDELYGPKSSEATTGKAASGRLSRLSRLGGRVKQPLVRDFVLSPRLRRDFSGAAQSVARGRRIFR